MERIDLETWFARHPESIHAHPRILLDLCESEVRDHARHDAWRRARDVAESSLQRFEGTFGLPASEVFVTREVCHEIARELRRHEPHPDAAIATGWVADAHLEKLDAEARRIVREWLSEVAEREEHATWRSIVQFTDHLARWLIRSEGMTNRLDWDLDHTYSRVAARVTRVVMREFEAHAASQGIEESKRSPH